MKNLVHTSEFKKVVLNYKDFEIKVTSINTEYFFRIDRVKVRYRITDMLRPDETMLTTTWVDGSYYLNSIDLNEFENKAKELIDTALKNGYRS